MILLHGFGTSDRRLTYYYGFISSMVRKKITVVFINLPFHLNRTPETHTSGEQLITYDDIQTLDFFHQAVVDVRRFIDISTRILSPSNIYLCGISLGCMISTILMAFEDRIKRAALLIGGGNWEKIHWNSVLRFVLKGDCSRDSKNSKRLECKKAYRVFPSFLDELKKTEKKDLSPDLEKHEKLRKVTPKACFLCDPMAYGHMVDPDKILMINSRFDMYFPRRSATYLWNELGRPRIRWVNGFHSSRILISKKIQDIIYDFFTGRTEIASY